MDRPRRFNGMFRPRWTFLLVVAVAGTAYAQSSRINPHPGDTSGGTAIRRLRIGLDANPAAQTSYRDADWITSIRMMRATAANHYHYAKVWSEIEPRPGTYDIADVTFKMTQSSPLPVAFNLRVVDAGARNMPD